MLINVTASRQVGIHEATDACQLIRLTTENGDVQINFGVVLNAALDEEVRITVPARRVGCAGDDGELHQT